MKRRRLLALLAVLLGAPLLVPEHPQIPVQGARSRDWNSRSFWYEPWGLSGVHKGIDIFADAGTPVLAPVSGLVLYRGELSLGGKVVLLLGPKWRLHYMAHLQDTSTSPLALVSRGEVLGTVGTSGNANGRPPHLHYSVLSLLPRPWAMTRQSQGWKKMFFIDPGAYLQAP